MGTDNCIRVETQVLRRVGENHSERGETLRAMAEELLRDFLNVPSYDGEFPGKMAAIGARVHGWLTRQAERLEEASAFLLGKAQAFELADQEVVQSFQGVQAGYEKWLGGVFKEVGPYGMVGMWFGGRPEWVPALWADLPVEEKFPRGRRRFYPPVFGVDGPDGRRYVRVDLGRLNSAYYYDEQGNVVETDLPSRFGVPNMSGVIWIEYDYEEATRPVTKEELPNLSEESVAIRLIVSEVGADRLVTNRNGLLEGVGICWTVENRLNRAVFQPGEQYQRPYGGGGENGTFISAATSGTQFKGMDTGMGLDPRTYSSGYVSEGDFKRAVDIAAVAYELQSGNNPAGLEIPDITKGATEGAVEYRHQCGPPGEDVYGEYLPSCDEAAEKAAGADPHKGPLVFKAKDRDHYDYEGGFYKLKETGVKIDYVPR